MGEVVIAAGRRHSLGVRADGTVVAAGAGTARELRVSGWVAVVAVAAGNVHTASNTGRSHSVGLRSDGTATATGWNGDRQCGVAPWRGLTAVAAGWRRTVGLRGDGTVLATGNNRHGQRGVGSWRNLVAISAGYLPTVGLTRGGRVLAVGHRTGGGGRRKQRTRPMRRNRVARPPVALKHHAGLRPACVRTGPGSTA